MQLVYKKEYKIRWYEIDFRGKVQVNAILNYMQDIAGDHALLLKLGVRDLLPRNLTWILSRYHIKFIRYPEYGESIIIKTWPSKMDQRFALRDFEAINEQGERVFIATSSWLLLDFEKKRPVRVGEKFPGFPVHDSRMIKSDFETLPTFNEGDKLINFRVRLSDLDINQHVNNVVYIQWALETIPRQILTKNILKELKVSYRGEAHFGDTVSSSLKTNGSESQFIHRLSNENTGKELTRLLTLWE